MKLKEFVIEKKWSIISGIAFLAILAVIIGGFSYRNESKFNSLEDEINRLFFSISSLETYSSAMISSNDGVIRKIDGMVQKPDSNPDDRSVDPELQSKLGDILKCLSELNQKVEALKITSEAALQPKESMEGTITESAEETITEITEQTITETAEKTITETLEETLSVKEEDLMTEPDTKVPARPVDPVFQVQPANMIKAGQDFILTVKANEVSNLYGYQFNLNYDSKKATCKGSLKSTVSGISTIFKKDMSGHLLVGATMIGDTPGYSGQNITICTMVFTATMDLDPSIFTIDGVNTVDANQNYIENISGWRIDVKAE